MKLALIFLAIFVAISHQQHDYYPRMMFAFPWLALPFPNQPAFYNNHEPMNDDGYPVDSISNRNVFSYEDEGEEYADTQSRVKGIISRYRPRPSFQDQQNARFLFNLFATTTGTFNNPFLKTATFTSTVTLSLNSVQNCVPANEVIANVQPCQGPGRRRRDIMNSSYVPEDLQFPSINPSNTFNLIATALPTSNDRLDLDLDPHSSSILSSSKDDINLPEISTEDDHNSREKRFFFINRNQFVVTSVFTTFVFVNSTITATVNLLNPVPAANAPVPCVPVPAIPPVGTVPGVPAIICVNCLPPGFVVCPAPAGR